MSFFSSNTLVGFLLASAVASTTFAENAPGPLDQFLHKLSPNNATIILHAGVFDTTQGSSQLVGINGLIGDYFSVANPHARNAIFGAGYFIHGFEKSYYHTLYGLDAYYFAPTTVRGNVTQEQTFTNLSYNYNLTNFPIYATARTLIKFTDRYDVTVDLGLGPNIIKTSDLTETSLDGGVTQPDDIFNGRTKVAFSATAGMGLKINHALGKLPLELDYRCFYLNQGALKPTSDQIQNPLRTGKNFANALMLSTSF